MARRCFYSFHYQPDSHRASQVRQIGSIEGNRPATDNDWQKVTSGGDAAITKWISDQMYGKSCTVVLVGSTTADRKWINYEIVKSWDEGMGVVGIYIHGLKNLALETSVPGTNPFDYIGLGQTGKKLSSIVKCYNPAGEDSKAGMLGLQSTCSTQSRRQSHSAIQLISPRPSRVAIEGRTAPNGRC